MTGAFSSPFLTSDATCYLVLGMLVPGLPADKGQLPGNPAAQERILGASLLAMAIADASHPFEFSGSTY